MTQTNKEYAEALFTLAVENNMLENYSEALQIIKNSVQENPDYTLFLDSPAVPLSERLAAVDAAFEKDFHEYIVSFLKLLCENGRIRELINCIDEFDELKRLASNITTATVYSAVELTDSAKEKLITKLEAMSGKTVEAVYVIDSSVLGGIKIEIDGKTIDGSVTNNLKRIKGVMNG